VFARNPVEEKVLESESLKDAVRLAMIAELDAISFYLQIARKAKDERVRKVFEDVAREEAEHFGEFVRLLKELDPSFEELVNRGMREVEELLKK